MQTIRTKPGKLRRLVAAPAQFVERRRLDAALRADAACYQAVVESQAEMVCRFRLDGTIVFVNGAYAQARGTTREALAGRSFWEFVAPADRANVRAMLERLTPDSPEVRIENRFRTVDGERWTLWINRALRFDAEGRVLEAQSSGIDITDRKRSEEALARSARQMAALYELTDRLQHVASPGEAHEAVLDAIVKALDCQRASILLFDGTGVMRFVAWRGLSEDYRRAVEGHSPWRPEERDPRPFGVDDIESATLDEGLRATIRAEGIRALAFVPLLSEGRLAGKFMVYYDEPHAFSDDDFDLALTIGRQVAFGLQRLRAEWERARVEQSLRESRRRLQLVSDNMPALIGYVDREHRYRFVNARYSEWFGSNPAELYGRHMRELLGAELYEHRLPYIERVLRGETVRFEARTPHRTLGMRDMNVAYIPHLGEDGRAQGVYVMGFDITEHKAAYRRLQEAEESLREADRRKDEFLATLSHELRNPLAPLRSALHLLRLSNAGVSATSIHEMMERQVNHLVRLVDDLLETARISRGTLELRRETVQLSAVVRNALEASEPLIRAAGHRLAVMLPGEPVWLDGDPVRLSQILCNLVNNSARYTDPGGEITVCAGIRHGVAAVSIRDNGAGIEPGSLPGLFELFNRPGRASGRTKAGLGVGLPLSLKLARMHGGTIKVHSDGPGRGSEFTLELPVAAAPPPEAEGMRPERRAVLPPARILVVDDNRDAADSLGMLLQFLGAEVRVAHDGPEALRAFGEYAPALVLLDIGMPGMDGYEVAQRIRSDFPDRRTPLVALTGWGQDEDRRQAREAGFEHHLIKPADVETLQGLLASLETQGTQDGAQ